MSQETYEWLRTNIRAGFAKDRKPWWASGDEPYLYDGPVPMSEVEQLLCSWSAYNEPLFTADMERVETHKLVRASDNRDILGVVGADVPIHSYSDWLVGTVKECVGDEAQVSSAGLLRRRSQAWVQIERPEVSTAAGGVVFAPYVLLSTSLDSSIATQLNQATTHTICDNTMALGRTQGVAFKKTKNSKAKLGDYRSVTTRLIEGETDFKAMVDELLSKKVSPSKFDQFISALVPIDEDEREQTKTIRRRKRQEITELYRNDTRVEAWSGTAWGVVQAVNTWEQHMSRLVNRTGLEMDDRNLRTMLHYRDKIKGTVSDTQTVKLLDSVLA